MKEEYDFSTMKSRLNPYAKQLKKQVTIRLETDVIDYSLTLYPKELERDECSVGISAHDGNRVTLKYPPKPLRYSQM